MSKDSMHNSAREGQGAQNDLDRHSLMMAGSGIVQMATVILIS